MSAIPTEVLSPEQYLARERKADARSEYYRGEAFAMGGASVWEKAFHFFNFQRETFMAHYHKRSNVESVQHVKAKFGDAVRSKTDVAMKNEALCKILCHNISCLISAFYELGIDANFNLPATSVA